MSFLGVLMNIFLTKVSSRENHEQEQINTNAVHNISIYDHRIK